MIHEEAYIISMDCVKKIEKHDHHYSYGDQSSRENKLKERRKRNPLDSEIASVWWIPKLIKGLGLTNLPEAAET